MGLGRVKTGEFAGIVSELSEGRPLHETARTTCVVKALPNPAMLIEIECVASPAGR